MPQALKRIRQAMPAVMRSGEHLYQIPKFNLEKGDIEIIEVFFK